MTKREREAALRAAEAVLSAFWYGAAASAAGIAIGIVLGILLIG